MMGATQTVRPQCQEWGQPVTSTQDRAARGVAFFNQSLCLIVQPILDLTLSSNWDVPLPLAISCPPLLKQDLFLFVLRCVWGGRA